MRRKGNGRDNSVMEPCFLNLKRVWPRDCANHAEAARGITDYIVGFYRLHSKLDYLSPNAYELWWFPLVGVSEKT
ncbi:MAG: hypothetical protein KBE25_05565 [Laribacter sp.]|nr:hypothetical protein [Laribacter sp.]MBP9527423.1 hypothetical protein [Laribacter sp.]MBP9608803.1 hypothetical protein [Laribacter sp.]